MDSRLETNLSYTFNKPEDLIAFGEEVNKVFYRYLYLSRVDDAWAVAGRYSRVLREAPDLFREEPWNSRLAFQLCKMEAVGAYFMARLGMYERALQSCNRASESIRQRLVYAEAHGIRPGWTQARVYVLAALASVYWLKPDMRQELASPQQLLSEWDSLLQMYATHDSEIGKQSNRHNMVLAFDVVMCSAILHGVLTLDDYNARAMTARQILLIDFPMYPLPDPEQLCFSMLHHYYYYSACFMLEACAKQPTLTRLKAYMELYYRSSQGFSFVLGEQEMSEFIKRDCSNEYRVVLARLGFSAKAAPKPEELSLAS